ncbi:MAG: DUF3106 domain-containing protein [Georgfuchsia sp.]
MARALVTILVAITLSFALPAGVAAATPQEQLKWSQLTPQQQQILAPLAKDWNEFSGHRRMKWLGIAKRYPAMTPEKQQRVQSRMKRWASLTPEERDAARAKFRKDRGTPEQRQARRQKWKQYQALPESEKKKFREMANRKARSRQTDRQPAPPLSGSATAK